MEYSNTKESNIKIINLLLIPGLMAIVYFLITNRLPFMGFVVIAPLLMVLLLQIIRNPIILYFSMFVLNYYVMGVGRYADISGISFFMDSLMLATLVLIFLYTVLSRSIEWKYAINAVTIGSFIWMIYCLAQIYNPTGVVKAWILSRGLVINGFIITLIVSLLFEKYKTLKTLLFILALFTLTAMAKAFIQKYVGFDAAEMAWLNGGGYKTHILLTGTRYFSFFTDAGNFGSNMGFAAVLYLVTSLFIKNKWLKVFYCFVGIMAALGLFLSGTRGAMIVPLVGLAMLAILSKNFKILIASGTSLILIYVFFAFTTIGQGNSQIRRMRTAFTPTEDASFNVRKENQQKLAVYMKDKPFGEGLGLSGVENQDISIRFTTLIPHDSWYVKIWVETGIVGLILYIGFLLVSIACCARIIMFKIKNQELKGILTGFLCGICGILASAYSNPFFGQFPTAIIAFTGFALILKGEYFDKQLSEQTISKSKLNS